MYLLPIHVPIYVAGEKRLVTTEWRRSLILLRDSLEGRFGTIHVMAPSLPADDRAVDQTLEEMTEENDGIKLISSFDARCRARHYWLRERKPWRGQLDEAVKGADVVHTALDDVFRPISYEGFLAAAAAGKAIVFVQDTDIVLQNMELNAGGSFKARAKGRVYGAIYERLCRHAVKRADLSLLKGTTLLKRYGRYARNACNFHDTSYPASDMISEDALEDRLRGLVAGRPVRLVYCGRLVARKGIDHSIRIIKILKDRGAAVEFDMIGNGSERASLQGLIDSLELDGVARLLGASAYGSELLGELARYDGLLFTPLAEDTPRMIFDGYAAGLPLLGYDIEYVRERAAEEQATALLPKGDCERAAEVIAELIQQPERLAELARAARRAGAYHASENWYRRRAEWTFKAVERHRREAR